MISVVPDEPDFLFLLHDVARQLRVDADRRARAHDMTRAQWVILWWLDRQPGLSQKELAELIDVEPITVARLVDRLADRGMLERRDDPADRRIWRLHLLPPARPVLAHMRGERTQIRRLLSAGIDAPTLQTVEAALKIMKANIVAELRTRGDRASETPAPHHPAAQQPAAQRRPAGKHAEPTLEQDFA